jgi:histidine ammonia-lyase
MCFNTAAVVGIEAMAAAQGIEFSRPLRSSPIMEQVFSGVRERVAFLDKDRLLAPDIESMRQWGCSGELPTVITQLFPSTSA